MRQNAGLVLAVVLAVATTSLALLLGFNDVKAANGRACGSLFSSGFESSGAPECERARSNRATWMLAVAVAPGLLAGIVYLPRVAKTQQLGSAAPLWRRPAIWLISPTLIVFVVAVATLLAISGRL